MKKNDKQPKYLNVNELFSTDNYVIPVYQRNYDWQEPHITQLIQDIVDYVLKSKSNNAQTKPSRYYIGSLIAYERKSEGSVVYEIIDGQQRLITLTILLNVIKKEYKTINWYKKLNLSFDSRKVASDTLLHLFEGKSLDNNGDCDIAIQQGYNIAKKSLAKILNDNNLSIDEFCNYFFENVTILRVLVPEDTDLNHYFEIMNSRGEQLEKHEFLKARMLEILEDENLKYAFNLIWEATSNMEKYVQYGFSVDQRNQLFGQDWDNLVDQEMVYEILQPSKQTSEQTNQTSKPTNQTSEESLKELLEKEAESFSDNSSSSKESPDRFNSIINFSNFLLHILRIQLNQDVPLDDKRLLEPFLEKYDKKENDKNKEFIKQFGYNLLKGKFYFDKYIIKREYAERTDHWSLKRLNRDDKGNLNYVNTFDDDDVNREILMLLSMFHVSSPTLVYKHWLNAALKFLMEYSGTDLKNDYKTYLENLAKAFLYDRFLAKEPKDYFKIIYNNNSSTNNTSKEKKIELEKLHQGTAVENFIFNYLDYLLWKDYKTKKSYFKIKNGQAFEDDRIKNFEFKFRSSVEHYYPQHPIDENSSLNDEDLINNFGNLCLISSSKNSRLSNFMPNHKKEFYSNPRTNIDSIKQRIMMEYENWGEEEIKEHSEKMIEILTK